MNEIVELLNNHLGLDPDSLGKGTLTSTIRQRMQHLGVDAVADYYVRLEHDAEELASLVAEVIVHETWFFRQATAFELLASHVKQVLSEKRTASIISLPCSTGEEPYSAAIELFENRLLDERVFILGVDIGKEALDKARAGVYGRGSFRASSSRDINKHFSPNEGGSQVLSEQIRKHVHFREGNALNSDVWKTSAPWDIVFCRNLLIYLDKKSRNQVVDLIKENTPVGSLVFTGHAETSLFLQPGFQRHGPTSGFCYERTEVTETPQRTPLDWKIFEASPPPPSRRLKAISNQRPTASTATLVTQPPTETSSIPDIALGLRLADEGKIEEALGILTQVILHDSENVEAKAKQGVLLYSMGRKKEAAAVLRETLYLAPENEEALVYMSLIEQENGNMDRVEILQKRISAVQGKADK